MENFEGKKSAQERISELKNELEICKLKYSILADCTDCGIWEYDIGEKFLHQSKKLSGKYENQNLDIPDFRNTVIGWGIVHPEDLGIFEAYCDSMDRGERKIEYELRSVTDSKNFDWLRFIGVTVYDESAMPVKVIGKTLNVTKEKKQILNLQKRANRDSLTNVCNKAYTKELVEKYIQGRETSEKKHVLFIIDIDNFKEINDQYGHLYGDEILVKFSTSILSGFTKNDVVGRIGGDEFLVFATNINSEKDAIKYAERIFTRYREFMYAGDKKITISMGYALYPRDAVTYEALYRSADIALYQAKRKGKNQFCSYNKFEKYNVAIGETKRKNRNNLDKDNHIVHNQKNIFDYAFQIINASDDIIDSIYRIFLETGIYYQIDRILFIEYRFSKHEANLVQSWSREKKYGEDYGMVKKFNTCWMEVEKAFQEDNSFLIQGAGGADENFCSHCQAFSLDDKMQGMVQFPVMNGEQVAGFVSYETACQGKDWKESDIATLSDITKMISGYLLCFRGKLNMEDELLYTRCALDSQKLTYYSIDSETYELLYVSSYANELFPHIQVGKKCYEAVMGENDKCNNCPINGLKPGKKKHSQEIYSQKYDTWFTSSVTVIKKTGGSKQFLLSWTDMTTFFERVMSTDQLTGTLSYDKFRAEALKKISNKNNKYAVALFGIREFSRINDEYGFQTGDIVIKALANRIRVTLSEREIVCRIKGDDFILLMEGQSEYKLTERVENICKTLTILLHEKYHSMQINCICGIYQIQNLDFSISKIFDKANRAKKMAQGAKTDENSIFVYTKEIEKQYDEEKALERDLAKAIRNDEFKVYIQPKVNLPTMKIGGAEALVRWISPDGKMISPGKFIPLAEKNGMVTDIDHFVYRTLFAQMRKWLDEHKKIPIISINVSRLHFNDDKFPGYLNDLLNQYGIPHNLIEVEITESVFFGNVERMISMIKSLRELGVSISMDDFGTGYSTLSLMKSLPIDVLKVDGSFFMSNNMDMKNRAVISTIIHLSKSLGFDVVCEGIETQEQVEFIKEEDCDMAQGFYYFKPVPMEEFQLLLDLSK